MPTAWVKFKNVKKDMIVPGFVDLDDVSYVIDNRNKVDEDTFEIVLDADGEETLTVVMKNGKEFIVVADDRLYERMEYFKRGYFRQNNNNGRDDNNRNNRDGDYRSSYRERSDYKDNNSQGGYRRDRSNDRGYENQGQRRYDRPQGGPKYRNRSENKDDVEIF